MLIVGSAIDGYVVEANDGRIGTVKTFLFDDTTWKIRWLVIDTGRWLPGRQVLIAPSAIGTPDHTRQELPVHLTRAQVEASPDIGQDQPVTMQMQSELHSYYGWDPYWGPNFFATGIGGFDLTGGFGMPYRVGSTSLESDTNQRGSDDGDLHLRSALSVGRYEIHATDGLIGHVENVLVDDVTWAIRYLIVDTRNWWFGAHVLISPFAVTSIDWSSHQIMLNVSQEQVKTSPSWDPLHAVDQMYERRLHEHYRWPGYNW